MKERNTTTRSRDGALTDTLARWMRVIPNPGSQANASAATASVWPEDQRGPSTSTSCPCCGIPLNFLIRPSLSRTTMPGVPPNPMDSMSL